VTTQQRFKKSGRQDLNLRPLHPQCSGRESISNENGRFPAPADGASATTSPKYQKHDVESTGHLSAEGDLKAALLMIERLPLSDKQKAEAVRRLLASQQSRSMTHFRLPN
jgi:hypothetical protein